MRIERPCSCCGTTERSPPRNLSWAAWRGEATVAWSTEFEVREDAPEVGEAEDDHAGLHYGWAYAGNRQLNERETGWLEGLLSRR